MTPKQKMILTILLLVFSPAIFGTVGGVTGLGDLGGALAGISAVLMPIGIVFTIMRYKAEQRRLREAMMQNQMYGQVPMQYMMPPNAPPYSLPQPGQQAVFHPAQQPQHPVQQPVYHPPVTTSPPATNPLKSPGSITEDETKRFQ